MNDGVRIYYERVGHGPAVLFLHGLAGNHAAWFRQVPYFARDHRVITIAQRGFAPSSENRGEYDNSTLVADAIAVLESLGEKDVTVVGQSMGGWTALGIAIERPDLVRSVVLSATVAGIFDDDIERHYARVIARARDLANKPPALGAHPALGRRFGAEHPDDAYLYQLLTSFGSPSPGKVAEDLGRTRFDDAAIARLRAPALFVVGEDDEIFPPDIVRRAAARVRGARVVTVRRAGHSPYFERPAEWNRTVARFIVTARAP
jgi:pimeloyl-ACP methyl ester carboxylesterase